MEQIRNQVNYFDWSAQICKGASVKDLDEEAVIKAREKYKTRNKNKLFASEIDRWDTLTFLDKARITLNGEITNSAIILPGKPEATHYLSPSVAKTSKFRIHKGILLSWINIVCIMIDRIGEIL